MRIRLSDKSISKWLTLIVIILLVIAGLCSGCGAVDKLEASHYWFWDHTPALVVVKKVKRQLYCQSPSGVRFYRIPDKYNQYHTGDTINLRDHKNYWMLAEARFITKIPD